MATSLRFTDKVLTDLDRPGAVHSFTAVSSTSTTCTYKCAILHALMVVTSGLTICTSITPHDVATVDAVSAVECMAKISGKMSSYVPLLLIMSD